VGLIHLQPRGIGL